MSARNMTQAVQADTSLLQRVDEIARGPLAAIVTDIDLNGHYPLEILRTLGEAGALAPHLQRNGADFGLAIQAMATVSRQCGATGFLMWCHMVCGLYLEKAPNSALNMELLSTHALGHSFGGTALSNPMKALAGIERMALEATPAPGGYRVSGVLPWVSHIAPGQYCGAMARIDGQKGREILFLLRFDGQATLRPCPHFSGMEGTSTWSIRLDDYFLPAHDVIAVPAQPLVSVIKAPFILLQAGMAAGVVQGCIDSMLEVEPQLGHVNRFLEDRPDTMQAELDAFTQRALKLARTPAETDPSYLLDVLDVRAHGSELALRASQSALLHQGARGYLSTAAPQRRVREAQFVAIVTPAIKHLRLEMARLMTEELPA
ncbi:acyl-CoA dehydrogenase family protein [Komagataeibacter europaeus]|uniref:acyl-CoA dehydrogenase family protein n=1 Tax=Komagataeibacter europaeus TaxID=33995 RepID=UPI0002DABF6A|nr:acyl-CoA dehydrogenase family protein [Komagataeibacter europaeus]GBQ47782.1 acyl-CoA dehydrogenase [Komagataeibacter europaeus LMG 18890]